MNFFQKSKEIIEGYKNYLTPMDEHTERETRRRANICSSCPALRKGKHLGIMPDSTVKEIEGMYCGDCGCPLSPKTRSESSKCPQGKW